MKIPGDAMTKDKGSKYTVREAVAVFHNADQLEEAVDKLQVAGFGRSDINVMAGRDAIAQKLGNRFEPIKAMEDDPRIPQATFISKNDMAEATGAIISVPLYIGAIAGTAAVAASGGALALVIAAVAAGGLAGGGIGGIIAKAVGDQHAKAIEANLLSGGLLLWVRIRNASHESKAIEILTESGGSDVHTHDIERTWGEQDVPLHDWQPDPLIEKGPDYQ